MLIPPAQKPKHTKGNASEGVKNKKNVANTFSQYEEKNILSGRACSSYKPCKSFISEHLGRAEGAKRRHGGGGGDIIYNELLWRVAS